MKVIALFFGLLAGCGASDLDPDAALEQGAKGGMEESSRGGAERGRGQPRAPS